MRRSTIFARISQASSSVDMPLVRDFDPTTSISASTSAPENIRDFARTGCSTASSLACIPAACRRAAAGEPRDLFHHTLAHIVWSRRA
jgi:hypothetical protein